MQKVDELLAEVDVARTLGREAVTRAEKTLAEANETLQILLGQYLHVHSAFCFKRSGNVSILVSLPLFCNKL